MDFTERDVQLLSHCELPEMPKLRAALRRRFTERHPLDSISRTASSTMSTTADRAVTMGLWSAGTVRARALIRSGGASRRPSRPRPGQVRRHTPATRPSPRLCPDDRTGIGSATWLTLREEPA
jgi:hypothetical protein